MAQPSGLQLVELALHGAAFLCGIICASALTVMQAEFGGRCILYGSVRYNGTLTLSSSSHASLCYFVTAISVLTAIFSFLAVLWVVYSCWAGDGVRYRIWLKGTMGFSGLMLFFLLISACVLRVGMDSFCSSILKSAAAASCQEAQHKPWVPLYRAERFYDNLYTAETAAWVNFFFWCLMLLLLILESLGKGPFQPQPSSHPQWHSERVPIVGDS